MVTVEGGTLPQDSQLAGESVATFQIGKCEVTLDEWQEVKAWAVMNGYTDMGKLADGTAGNHPVCDVAWYDVAKWCNAKSEKESLTPVYRANGEIYRTGKDANGTVPTVDLNANGYRLPTEAEWEWAARGGVKSKGYTYSGSNDLNTVAWCSDNSGGGTREVGTKAANELGLYDMSGNVWERCETLVDGAKRWGCIRGGSWFYRTDFCAVGYRYFQSSPGFSGNTSGFRLARNAR